MPNESSSPWPPSPETARLLDQIIESLRGARKVQVVGHVRPDGDCIGSLLGIHYMLVQLGVEHALSAQDIRDSLLGNMPSATRGTDEALGNGFQLPEILNEIERRYVERAWEESGQRVKAAAELLGFPNYQNFSDRMKKYGLKR